MLNMTPISRFGERGRGYPFELGERVFKPYFIHLSATDAYSYRPAFQPRGVAEFRNVVTVHRTAVVHASPSLSKCFLEPDMLEPSIEFNVLQPFEGELEGKYGVVCLGIRTRETMREE